MRPRFGSAIASVGRWRDLFNACFEVLLYDLTSTYLEANPPFPEEDKRRFGYSRDRRSDCVQVVIALIVTPEGLPLAYEVLPFRGPVAPNQSLNPLHPRIGQVGLSPWRSVPAPGGGESPCRGENLVQRVKKLDGPVR